MKLKVTNDLGNEKIFNNVIGLNRQEGNLDIQIRRGDGSTEWKTVVDGRVESLTDD